MGKIVINQTDEKQTVILTNDAEGIQGVYFGEDGVEKPVGNQGEWTTDGIASNMEPSGDITITLTSINSNAFREKKSINKVIAPNLTTLGANAFADCSLTELDAPELTTVNDGSLSYTQNLKRFYSEKLNATAQNFLRNSGVEDIIIMTANKTFTGNYWFQNCASLKRIIAPLSAVTTGGTGWRGLTSLELVDIKVNGTYFDGLPVTAPLKTIIFRKADGIVTLSNADLSILSSIGENTAIDVYVPSALIDTYVNANNWSTLYSNAKCAFKAIEGSIYESTEWWKD